MRTIRVGNGCGFWGDNLDAPISLAEDGQLDYLTLEYLAELTMSILARQKQKRPDAGFAHDFLDVLDRLTPALKNQPQLRIITNAGGMNAVACAQHVRSILDQAGLSGRRVAAIQGDDLLPHLDDLLAQGHPFAHLDNAQPLAPLRDRIVSANAYLGARPIVDALKQDASIVVTGRVADASLAVAPAVFEFEWPWDDWNRLAAATVAGHLIECGAQVTGGLCCNWSEVQDFANLGYPIAEIRHDGYFTITKPERSGGIVNKETVAEQLLYEVGDPRAYITPDVVADFTSVQLSEPSAGRVAVEHTRGKPATDTYKVSIAYRNGFAASSMLVVSGPDALAKSRLCGDLLLARVGRAGYRLDRTHIECLGSGDVVAGMPPTLLDVPEIVLRLSAQDHRKEAVERFTKEFAPLVTSGPPGVTGYTTGRAPVREVFAFWPTLIQKTVVKEDIRWF